MNECIASSIITRKSLGLKMLSTALDGPPWSGFGVGEFGARPRDYGYEPNYDELVEWRGAFIDVIIQLAASGDPELERPARSIRLTNSGNLVSRSNARQTRRCCPYIKCFKSLGKVGKPFVQRSILTIPSMAMEMMLSRCRIILLP